MHIVHYSQKYPNISEALTKKNGLAVLAIFFEVTNCNNTEFQCIIKKLPSLRHPVAVRQRLAGVGFPTRVYCNLLKLLPKNFDDFFRYSGSLTTPPCSESVVWTVYPKAVKISSWQINQLRTQLIRIYDGDRTVLGTLKSRRCYRYLSHCLIGKPSGVLLKLPYDMDTQIPLRTTVNMRQQS
ncbi:Hypothetical predicted protein [Octopus vulgaris]|uniref:carbonic anhydrase n=1 Tax=Octopus vulgaris TaxID=6645 RepID=A0AA36AYT8_OCTVU|nr:Hypothetical predicted protein [Octopus vulgaris]